jgi:hypothetical protein
MISFKQTNSWARLPTLQVTVGSPTQPTIIEGCATGSVCTLQATVCRIVILKHYTWLIIIVVDVQDLSNEAFMLKSSRRLDSEHTRSFKISFTWRFRMTKVRSLIFKGTFYFSLHLHYIRSKINVKLNISVQRILLKMSKKLVLTVKIDEKLKTKNLSRRELSRLTNYPWGYLNQMITGKTAFSKNLQKKVLPILEVSREEFESWILADKYPKEVLERAIQVKKIFPYKKKSILTTKIDTILQEKDMSRTALSKEIKYSQSSINAMIVGKLNMSKSVMERVSNVLEIPQIEIQSWIVADKYSLDLLERAWRI